MAKSMRGAAVGEGGPRGGHAVCRSARLQRQADELAPDSSALLDRVGLRPGDRAIDVGCGPRGIIELLAARVWAGGRAGRWPRR